VNNCPTCGRPMQQPGGMPQALPQQQNPMTIAGMLRPAQQPAQPQQPIGRAFGPGGALGSMQQAQQPAMSARPMAAPVAQPQMRRW